MRADAAVYRRALSTAGPGSPGRAALRAAMMGAVQTRTLLLLSLATGVLILVAFALQVLLAT